jgi:heme-degrading monooxygenase HmoA
MAEVNVIDWHVHPFRADRWYEGWKPALDRAAAFGATSISLTRSEDDPLHFRQTTVWERREDFDAYWASDEVSVARQAVQTWYNKPLLPSWHVVVG